MADLNTLVQQEKSRLQLLKSALISELHELPEFAGTSTLGSAFTVMRSEMVGSVWSAEYYDRNYNIQSVTKLITSASSALQIQGRCQKVIATGKCNGQRLHHTTIKTLKSWCQNDS